MTRPPAERARPPVTAPDCAAMRTQLPSYHAGSLPADVAWQVEWHAAHCPDCTQLLERPLLDGADASGLDPRERLHRDGAPSSLERTAMRRAILARDGSSRASRRLAIAWPWGVALAAAAAIVLFVVRRSGQADDRVDRPSASVPPMAVATPSVAPASMASAMALATAGAAAEFAEIDRATGELDTLLARDPDDAELRAFRASLEARHRELARLVAAVTE